MLFSQKLVDRYDKLKQQIPDCILVMQVDTFVQVMDEDARAVSQEPPGDKVAGLRSDAR